MHASRLSRRAVLAGSAATALTTVALPQGRAHAAEATAATPSYRWRNAVIGGTGFITGVLFHPAVRGLAYARTDIGGAYRWDERAARWTPLTDHLGWDDWNLLGVESLAVDPAHPDRPYLALGAYAQSWAGNGAVLRSDDRGATWTRSDLDVKLGANEDGRGAGWASLKDVAVFDVSETPFLDWGDGQPKFGWWIQALALDPYDSKYLVYGTGATLYGTRDLRRWAPRIRGLEETAVRQLISPPAGEAHLISGLGDIGVMYHERLAASPSRGMATNPVFGSATGLAQAAAKPSYVVRAGWGDHGNGAYSHDGGRTWAPWVRINDDAHQWGWIGEVITGDPRVYGRVYLGTNGRGIQYGEPI